MVCSRHDHDPYTLSVNDLSKALLHCRFECSIAGQQLVKFQLITPFFEHDIFKYLLKRQHPVMGILVVFVLLIKIRVCPDAVCNVDEFDPLLCA